LDIIFFIVGCLVPSDKLFGGRTWINCGMWIEFNYAPRILPSKRVFWFRWY